MGSVLLVLALTPADAIKGNRTELDNDGSCYSQFSFRDSPYFDNGLVAQVPPKLINGGQGCGTGVNMGDRLLPYANSGSFVLQIFGAANGVKEVEISKEGRNKWMPMKRKDGAAWEQKSAKHILESGSKVSVRVTSTKGKKAVLKGVIESGWHGEDIYNGQTNF
ncbi:unnamed protein product [Closterium sp. NIES-64]|nr:unnamed protein product [Closterium sp. NIES-64]